MSQAKTPATKEAPASSPNANVVALPTSCPVCSKKATRAGFCGEHFLWFKAGLVNRKGAKPTDFDRKYQAYIKKAA